MTTTTMMMIMANVTAIQPGLQQVGNHGLITTARLKQAIITCFSRAMVIILGCRVCVHWSSSVPQ